MINLPASTKLIFSTIDPNIYQHIQYLKFLRCNLLAHLIILGGHHLAVIIVFSAQS